MCMYIQVHKYINTQIPKLLHRALGRWHGAHTCLEIASAAILFSITPDFHCPPPSAPSRSARVTILSFDHLIVWSSDHLIRRNAVVLGWDQKSSYLWIGRSLGGRFHPQMDEQQVIDWRNACPPPHSKTSSHVIIIFTITNMDFSTNIKKTLPGFILTSAASLLVPATYINRVDIWRDQCDQQSAKFLSAV